MLRVGMTHTKPGMVLALPVYQPRRPDTVLLAPGVTLDDQLTTGLDLDLVGEPGDLGEVTRRTPGKQGDGGDLLDEVVGHERRC